MMWIQFSMKVIISVIFKQSVVNLWLRKSHPLLFRGKTQLAVSLLSYFICLLSNFLLKALIISSLKMNNNCCPTAYKVCGTEEWKSSRFNGQSTKKCIDHYLTLYFLVLCIEHGSGRIKMSFSLQITPRICVVMPEHNVNNKDKIEFTKSSELWSHTGASRSFARDALMWISAWKTGPIGPRWPSHLHSLISSSVSGALKKTLPHGS